MRAVLSHLMEHFLWDFHGNPIPRKKPEKTSFDFFAAFLLAYIFRNAAHASFVHHFDVIAGQIRRIASDFEVTIIGLQAQEAGAQTLVMLDEQGGE